MSNKSYTVSLNEFGHVVIFNDFALLIIIVFSFFYSFRDVI